MGDNYFDRNREGWVPLVQHRQSQPAPAITEEVIAPQEDPKAALIEEFEREFKKLRENEVEIVAEKTKKQKAARA